MLPNSVPLNPVTDEDREIYERDGCVVLRGVCNQAWVDRLLPVARRLLRAQTPQEVDEVRSALRGL